MSAELRADRADRPALDVVQARIAALSSAVTRRCQFLTAPPSRRWPSRPAGAWLARRSVGARVVVAESTRSGERARRARGHTARSAPPRPRAAGSPSIRCFIGSTPPCRASAPPRSPTARAASERPDSVSIASVTPLRFGALRPRRRLCRARFEATPFGVPTRRPGSARRCDSTTHGPRTRDSRRPPTRTDRRRRAPVRTRDIARIDRPRAAPARSGWTRAAVCRTLPRGSARPRAASRREPGLHLISKPTATPPPREAERHDHHALVEPQAVHRRPQVLVSPPAPLKESTSLVAPLEPTCAAVTTTYGRSSRRDSEERVRRRRRHRARGDDGERSCPATCQSPASAAIVRATEMRRMGAGCVGSCAPGEVR